MSWFDDSDEEIGLPSLPGQKYAQPIATTARKQAPRTKSPLFDKNAQDDDDSGDDFFSLPTLPSKQPKTITPAPTTKLGSQKAPKSKLALPTDSDDGDDVDNDDDDDGDDFLPSLPSHKASQPQPALKSQPLSKPTPAPVNPTNTDDDDDWSDDDDLPIIPSAKPKPTPQTSLPAKKSALPDFHDDNDGSESGDDDFNLPSLPSAKQQVKPQPKPTTNQSIQTSTSTRSAQSTQSPKAHSKPATKSTRELGDSDFSGDDANPSKFNFVDEEQNFNAAPALFGSTSVQIKMPFSNIAAPTLTTAPSTHHQGSQNALPSNFTAAPTQFSSAPPPASVLPPKQIQPEVPITEHDSDDDWTDDELISPSLPPPRSTTQRPPQSQPTKHQANPTRNPDKPAQLPCGCHCQCTVPSSPNHPLAHAHHLAPPTPETSRVYKITQWYINQNTQNAVHHGGSKPHFDEQNVPFCDNCEYDESTVVCLFCDEFLCDLCYKVLHLREVMKKTHKRQYLEVFFDNFVEKQGQNALQIAPMPQYRFQPVSTLTSPSQQQQQQYPSPLDIQSSQPASQAVASSTKKIKKSTTPPSIEPSPHSHPSSTISSSPPLNSPAPPSSSNGNGNGNNIHPTVDPIEAQRQQAERELQQRQGELQKARLQEKKAQLKLEREHKLKEKAEKKAKRVVIGDDEGVLDSTKDVFSGGLTSAGPITITKKKAPVKKEKPTSHVVDDLPPPKTSSRTHYEASSSDNDAPKVKKGAKKKVIADLSPPPTSKSAKPTKKYTDEDLFGPSGNPTKKKTSKQQDPESDDEPKKGRKKNPNKPDIDDSTTAPPKANSKVWGRLKEMDQVRGDDLEDEISRKTVSGIVGNLGQRRQKGNIFDDDENEDPASIIDRKFGLKKKSGPF